MKREDNDTACVHCGCQGQQAPNQTGCERNSMTLIWPESIPCKARRREEVIGSLDS
ncbi:rCG55043 [Rattus norvegicus]|uniref:RCG55043 n=1 Tax=Rattus norvegicus TaxID=10116 RepID=A6IIJ0_RAT|nr:rCG55043 [Rattus norvegicus]